MTISTKTQAAVAKYGRETCLRAAQLHAEGEGGRTVGIYLGLTTRQADAAIDAGEELASQPRQYRAIAPAGLGYTVRQLLPHTWTSAVDALHYARVMFNPSAQVEPV